MLFPVAQSHAADWQFQLTPYGWLPGVGGDVDISPDLDPVRIDSSFGELFRNVDAGFLITGAARNGRFVALGDFSIARLSMESGVDTPEIDLGLISIPSVRIDTRVIVRQTSFTVAAGYSIVAQPDLSVDLMAGIRRWVLETELRLDMPEAIPLPSQVGAKQSWVDPIVAVRARQKLSPRWALSGYGDIGGVIAGTKLTWQLQGTVDYRAGSNFYLSAGYRHIAFDYVKDDLQLDMAMSGPLIGATFTF